MKPLDTDTPMTSDLEDISIHEPSIRTGESVSGLDKFINEKKVGRFGNDWITADDLREFMKGKVVVDSGWLALARCPNSNNRMHGGEPCQWCDELQQALRPMTNPDFDGIHSASKGESITTRPAIAEMIQAVADRFGVTADCAAGWLGEINFDHFLQPTSGQERKQ